MVTLFEEIMHRIVSKSYLNSESFMKSLRKIFQKTNISPWYMQVRVGISGVLVFRENASYVQDEWFLLWYIT